MEHTSFKHQVAIDEGMRHWVTHLQAIIRTPAAFRILAIIQDDICCIWINKHQIGIISLADETTTVDLI